MLRRTLLASFFLVPYWAVAQPATPGMRLSDEAIIQKLSRRIRWDWFWIGYATAGYEEGVITSYSIHYTKLYDSV